MARRRVLWLGAVVVLVAGLVVLAPGSPAYLPNVLNGPGQYDGHSNRYWTGALQSPDAAVRRQAAFALGATGTEAAGAVPALAAVLGREPDPEVRREAALALYKIAPASGGAVPALATALGDDEAAVRMNAVLALFRLRAESRPAVPALVAALQDERNQSNANPFHHSIREIAALALGRAGAGAEAVPALTGALRREELESMRIAAAQALGMIGPAARPAAPQLRGMARDKSTDVRQAAEEALRAINPPAPAEGDDARRPAEGP
jgi:HEAT repeat protein